MFRRLLVMSLGLVLTVSMLLNLSTLNAYEVEAKSIHDGFAEFTQEFSVDLLKRSFEKKNVLVSPLSVMIALSMTANGADNETLRQMEKVLSGGAGIDELNEYLLNYINGLPDNDTSKLNISNSIWFRDSFMVFEDFLHQNAACYRADAYKAPFDETTVKDINYWVKDKTDGMIDKILDTIPDEAVMYLINSIVFDAEWQKIYAEDAIKPHDFANWDGSKAKVEMMFSEESFYIEDERSKGFIKPYKNGDYSFVAILPDGSLEEYIDNMTGETYSNLLANATPRPVQAGIPKFSYEFGIILNDILKAMGMPDAFDEAKADFSRIGFSQRGRLCISRVLHKTFISVDERGTKAGAATKVEIVAKGMSIPKPVILDRPFVYAIVDSSTNIPIFIGAVTDLG